MGSISEVDTINRLGNQQQQQKLASPGKIPTAGSGYCRIIFTLLPVYEMHKVNA
jgi:hypothetical protein